MSWDQIAALVALIGVAILVVPGTLRMNIARGETLRNVALWLAVIAALALLYRWLG